MLFFASQEAQPTSGALSEKRRISAPRAWLDAPALDAFRCSPDGKWIAYVSDKSGRPEISLRTHYPEGDEIPVFSRRW